MRLSHFTDFGLRMLLYLSQRPEDPPATITELAEQFDISRNHLVKVVQFLSNHQIIIAHRGRNGGIKLAKPSSQYRIGDLVRLLEREDEVINCKSVPCILIGKCILKGALENAYQNFFHSLNHYTLADVCKSPTKEKLDMMFRDINSK